MNRTKLLSIIKEKETEKNVLLKLIQEHSESSQTLCDRDSINKLNRYGYNTYRTLYSEKRPTFFMRTYQYLIDYENTLEALNKACIEELNTLLEIKNEF